MSLNRGPTCPFTPFIIPGVGLYQIPPASKVMKFDNPLRGLSHDIPLVAPLLVDIYIDIPSFQDGISNFIPPLAGVIYIIGACKRYNSAFDFDYMSKNQIDLPQFSHHILSQFECSLISVCACESPVL
eukprot:sb/3475353/